MAYNTKSKKLKIIIPSTPETEFTETDSDDTINGDNGYYSHYAVQYPPSPSPLKHPYRPVYDNKYHTNNVIPQPQDLHVNAKEIVSPDMLAVANLFASMKQALCQMSTTFDTLERQSDRMGTLAVEVRQQENIKRARLELERQIMRQKQDISNLRQKLAGEVRNALEKRLREKLCAIIQDSVAAQVKEKVQAELAIQMPQKLRKDLWQETNHSPEIKQSQYEVPKIVFTEPETVTELTTMNDENMEVQSPADTHLMSKPRFLLRPLPTPEQSPAYEISDSVPFKSTVPTPVSGYLKVPVCTPIKLATPTLKIPMRAGAGMLSPVPMSPSPVTPRDIVDDFFVALNSDKHKTLLEHYGLNDLTIPSPASGWSGDTVPIFKTPTSLKVSPLPVPPPASYSFNSVDTTRLIPRGGSRMQTPVLTVPPPRPQPRKGNSLAENLRLLPPLIIT